MHHHHHHHHHHLHHLHHHHHHHHRIGIFWASIYLFDIFIHWLNTACMCMLMFTYGDFELPSARETPASKWQSKLQIDCEMNTVVHLQLWWEEQPKKDPIPNWIGKTFSCIPPKHHPFSPFQPYPILVQVWLLPVAQGISGKELKVFEVTSWKAVGVKSLPNISWNVDFGLYFQVWDMKKESQNPLNLILFCLTCWFCHEPLESLIAKPANCPMASPSYSYLGRGLAPLYTKLIGKCEYLWETTLTTASICRNVYLGICHSDNSVWN